MSIRYNHNKIIKKLRYDCSMIVWPGECVYNQRETTLKKKKKKKVMSLIFFCVANSLVVLSVL